MFYNDNLEPVNQSNNSNREEKRRVLQERRLGFQLIRRVEKGPEPKLYVLSINGKMI